MGILWNVHFEGPFVNLLKPQTLVIMSNKASSSLFELIKSLTKSEKRYFKVLSSKHVIGNENKYIQLFDFIDSMEDYNEDIIIDHFKGEAFLNKFSITKARLYDHILNSLEQFHATNNVDAQLFCY